MPAYSLLIAWRHHDNEAGNYSWFGHADDIEQAERKARIESLVGDLNWPDDESRSTDEIMALDDAEFQDFLDESGAAVGQLLDSMEGVNIWKAMELLDALKLSLSCLRAQGYAEKLPAMIKINAVISAAEGRAS